MGELKAGDEIACPESLLFGGVPKLMSSTQEIIHLVLTDLTYGRASGVSDDIAQDQMIIKKPKQSLLQLLMQTYYLSFFRGQSEKTKPTIKHSAIANINMDFKAKPCIFPINPPKMAAIRNACAKVRNVLLTESNRLLVQKILSASTLNSVLRSIAYVKQFLGKGILDLKEPSAVVLPIDMLIDLSPDGTFSYKPGIESILKLGITIGVMVKEGDTRYNNIISVMDKRVVIIRGGVTAAPAQLGVPQNRIAFLFKDTKIPKDIKAILVESETPLHAAILFGVVYARVDAVKELGYYLKTIGNMKEDEVKAVLDELNRNGYLTLKLIRIAETLQEFQNRRLYIEVAA